MREEIFNFSYFLGEIYTPFINSVPPWIKIFINLFLLVMLIVIYAFFVWHLYRFISKRNPLGLDLNQYNSFDDSILSRFVRGGFYFIEYILILPFLITLVFSLFAFFLIIMSATEELTHILMISAAVIASIRVTAYYKQSLSQEVAKFLPLTLLTISVLNPSSFVQDQYLANILSHLGEITLFLDSIKYYLLFIIFLEIVLLSFYFIFSLFDIGETEFERNLKEEKEILYKDD